MPDIPGLLSRLRQSWRDLRSGHSVLLSFSAATTVDGIVTMIAGFVVLRWIDPARVGLWQSLLLVQSYAWFAQLGIFNGLNRELPFRLGKGDKHAIELVATAQAFALMTTGLLLFGGVISLFISSNPNVRYVLPAIFAATASTMYQTYLGATYRAGKAFKKFALINLLDAAAIVVTLPMVYFWDYPGLAIRYVVLAVVAAFTRYLWRPFPVRTKLDWNHLWTLLRVGLPLYAFSYLIVVGDSFPRVVLLSRGSVEMVGLYAPASAMIAVMVMVPQSIAHYIYPHMSFRLGETGDPRSIWPMSWKSSVAFLVVGVPLVAIAMFVVPPLVRIFLPAYVMAIPAIRWTLIGGLFLSASICTNALNSLKAWRWMSVYTAARVAFSFLPPLGFFYVFQNHVEGVAFGYAIGQGICFAVALIGVWRATLGKGAQMSARSRWTRALDGTTAVLVRPPRSPILVDGKPWDGSPLGDVAFVMTKNKNVVRQHQPVVRACVAAGLKVAFIYVDVDASWNPSLDDYKIEGTRIVQLPLRTKWLGAKFPNPVALLPQFAELKDMFPTKPFEALVTHIDDYGLCKVMCYWAKQTGVPSIVLQEGMTILHDAADTQSVSVERSAVRTAASRVFRGIPHDLFELRILYSYADYFCAYGETAKRELMTHGRTPESIFVLGNPSFDNFSCPAERRPTKTGGCTIMLVQQDIVRRDVELAFFDRLAEICCDDNDFRLIVKLHPLSDLDPDTVAPLIAKTEKRKSFFELRSKGDAVDMMDESDVMMTIHSTTAYHALVKGIPVVTVSYLAEGYGEFDAYRYGGAIDVRREEDLAQAVRDAALNDEVRLALYEGAQRVIEDHLYKIDGQASARIAQAIKGVATETAR